MYHFEAANIINFLKYLEAWELIAKDKDYKFIMDRMCYGLKIPPRAKLELSEYLTLTNSYEYLMPNRLNQDVLNQDKCVDPMTTRILSCLEKCFI
ncbi:hypothetical protein PV327_010209 [Microctonus hyperodae]|uniref:Uncharacterized protein n=1 Tax=Microctonus hyperodae TaxID=165561 RepID=A0AA39FS15_MICHY|nr:hypothetical protein PV327_010209 [Microctonus hyperodae]